MSRRLRQHDHPPIRLLVVNQRMDRTGAPMQLLALLPGLAQALGAHITFLQGADGPLTAAAAPFVDQVRGEPWLLRGVARMARSAPSPIAGLLNRAWIAGMRLRIGPVDVVYVNSLISGRLAAPFIHRPLVVHVHELAGLAGSFGEPARQLVGHASRTLVPSRAATDWVLRCGVADESVEIMPGAVPPSAFDAPREDELDALRTRLGIAPGDTVVSTVGWIGLLKGSDRFVDVAARLVERSDRPVRFLWVGGGSATGEEQRFNEDIRARGLDEVVTVLPAMGDLRVLYALTDVALVTSREESLSLTALESAAQGTPVVCFPGAGGPDTLAEEGIVSQPAAPDVESVVDLLLHLLVSPEERDTRGTHAREVVAVRHGVEAAQRQLVDVLAAAAARSGR